MRVYRDELLQAGEGDMGLDQPTDLVGKDRHGKPMDKLKHVQQQAVVEAVYTTV